MVLDLESITKTLHGYKCVFFNIKKKHSPLGTNRLTFSMGIRGMFSSEPEEYFFSHEEKIWVGEGVGGLGGKGVM